MKIYTKMGDHGSSRLFSGKEVSKNSPFLRTYGDVDELNSILGVVLSFNKDKEIDSILIDLQKKLFILGADLATPLDSHKKIQRIEEKDILELETFIDQYERELEPLTNFILPGGCESSSFLHLARTVCRRAEREAAPLIQDSKINAQAFIFLNRLSDFLFVLSRIVNKRKGVSETLWQV
ncbi:MAG: cob(I)yrinic acid a,c-diamide adenosyltransferase [Deltaproteobacteria bacterium]|nr:cob(I)yrinic acid a,c-diamide adenosyltransferase [Deltaproteobacteria bacterium]